MAKAKAVEMTNELRAKLYEWSSASQQLKAIKEKENALRVELVNLMCSATKLEGTETLDIGDGYKVKACKEQNYSLTNKQGETEKVLNAFGVAGHVDIATGLVRWSPEMSKSIYKEAVKIVPTVPGLDVLLAQALTIKPGMPTLEIIAPEKSNAT